MQTKREIESSRDGFRTKVVMTFECFPLINTKAFRLGAAFYFFLLLFRGIRENVFPVVKMICAVHI